MRDRYRYIVCPVDNLLGRTRALNLMNQVPRWQKAEDLSEPEQYLLRATAYIKIVLLHDDALPCSPFVGAAFIGTAEGYDREKTKAMIEFGKKDSSFLDKESIWINFQSWEDLPGQAPTALDLPELRRAWDTFIDACREAFPDAEQVVARSRHHRIWSYVYVKPWEVIAEVDMRGFEWTAPDGKIFKGYDERFARYGILRLPLK